MHIELTDPQLLQAMERELATGAYASAGEFIEALLRAALLDQPDDELDDETIAAIAEADAQIERGETFTIEEVRAFFKDRRSPKKAV